MKKTILYIALFLGLGSTIYAQCFSSISSGFVHVLGKKTDGSYWGWGYNQGGYFGNGTGEDSYVPLQLTNTANWQSYKAGDSNSFVIKTDGTLWATGLNSYGQLGLSTSGNEYLTFTKVGTATNWEAISAASSFTIALRQNGTLWGSGQNVYNQLGLGSAAANYVYSFVQIGTASNWKTMATSGCNSSVGIKTDGTLWGWGSNSCYVFGGSDVSTFNVPKPLTVTTDTDWDKVAGGGGHFLALKTNGTLWCWGDGGAGQTGHDPVLGFTSSELNQIPGSWKAMAGGSRYSMGIKTDGTLWQWGNNNITEINPSATNYSYIPVQLGTATNWESISCGNYHAVALRSDGSLWSWGRNVFGELGNGTTTPQAAPTQLVIAGCALGTEEFTAEPRFTISPSPAQQDIAVTYNGTQRVDNIIIYDLSGKQVYTLEAMGNTNFSSSFNIGQLAAGSYILALQQAGKTVVSKRFVKQ
ncbi:T9SS type A sorting domain-containing protein [Flavobacterium phycosphaerae]|uniref:T9SS type A sorting domain-containing protein n=1 Tax=Flavobacterium phycosphaerae TaxID=2697515 RepID=UPI0013895993|nr:T9SS type A sorting domain-containing protein [Flavobacterium phycosphaerae]